MTEPSASYEQPGVGQEHQTPPFAPIYTLVNNTSTRTTHHPQVHYIFSDDDPDLLTQALAQQHDANLNESASGPAPNHRAVLLDLAQDSEGGYDVSWASSLSPSWAVIDAQVSRISPPSSDSDGGNNSSTEKSKRKPDRLMLRVEGVESGVLGSEVELRLSGEKSGQGSGTGSGSGSGQNDRHKGEGEDYSSLVEEFDNRMTMLRKVVDAGEERRSKVSLESMEVRGSTHAADETAATASNELRRYAEDG
ncbi:hypothetical protein BJ170DRAFT_414074 [Xylariales sp. AK1849]|nr:hypothetical protein BJ170DRAFT_414074 [Xylariales sp. AK1849]